MTLSAAAKAMNGTLSGADGEFTGVSIDTRTLSPGDVYFAVKGPRFDGHNFVTGALNAGATAAVVSRALEVNAPLIEVEDTRIALGDLGAEWRTRFAYPVIGVTGSNGKTTVKEMIASIMGIRHTGLSTRGNLNNDLGVPLTLLRMREHDQYAVIEMGMNHTGEIYYLTTMAKPNIAVITNAAEAHLEGLGSVEAVAHAKGEILSGLPRDGVAIINADDTYAGLWVEMAEGRPIVSFGLEYEADVRCEYKLHGDCSDIHLITNQGKIDMRLSILGKHNVLNAMAASAASIAAGATLEDVRAGLEKLRAVSGRLETKQGINGARVIDDTYNANPASVSAGLEVLKNTGGETILVLGDMGELGDAGPMIHRRVGELAKRVGVSRLFVIGNLAQHAAAGYGASARHYQDADSLVEDLIDCLHSDATVLVKGSRLMKMETVVSGITNVNKS